MMRKVGTFALLATACASSSKHYFSDDFSEPKKFSERWVSSDLYGADQGKMTVTKGKYSSDPSFDLSLKTTEDNRHYGYTSKITPFNSQGKPLVIQFSVRHEQLMDCGGGYIKLFGEDFEPKKLGPDTPFSIMFGPDICGAPTRQTRIVLGYNGKHAHVKKLIRCETDEISHLYTLVIKPDRTYDVLIDNKKIDGGNINDDFDLLEPVKIPQEGATKPADWDDRPRIPDPEHKKPDGWDDVPTHVADPKVTKPDTWDDDMDGEWVAPQIVNPEYVGEWKQRSIPNPAYKGNWSAPLVSNPAYVDDPNAFQYKIGYVGFELWQVKSGSYFDNILITSDVQASRNAAEDILGYFFQEKDIKAKADEEERNRKEAARKAVEWDDKRNFQASKDAGAIEGGHEEL
jgi:calreticulin